MYIVKCRVSGGVTGTREGVLKKSGEIQRFETEEEANREAQRVSEINNGPHAKAYFQYWAEEDWS